MVVVAIINYQDKVLVGKKRKDSPKFLSGEWHIPGEGIEGNETDEQVLIRGMKDETGLDIKVGRYITSHQTPSSKKEARWYECFAETDKVIPGDDLEDAKFVSKKDVLDYCGSRAVALWPKEVLDYFSN